jgi:hypothetical protein
MRGWSSRCLLLLVIAWRVLPSIATTALREQPCQPDAAERRQVAQQSRSHVARWQAHGHVCSIGDHDCRPLLDVVPAGRHAGHDDVDDGRSTVCAASRRCAQRGRLPRIFVYDCMDSAHERLLRSPHVRSTTAGAQCIAWCPFRPAPTSTTSLLRPANLPANDPCSRFALAHVPVTALGRVPQVSAFFDPDLARNQYLSEYALHRALLHSPARVLDAAAADFFYVPFYARLAYADKVASKTVRRLQANLTDTLAACLRGSAAFRRSAGHDHLVAISSTRDPKKLFGAAWMLLKRAMLLRIEAAPDRRYEHQGSGRRLSQGGSSRRARRAAKRTKRDSTPPLLVLPYYVPNFADDENVSKVSKTSSVCFFGTATNPTRRQALEALRAVPGAMLQLGSKAPGIGGSESERESERQRNQATRRMLRQCKLCLVPAGITGECS